MAGEGEHTHSPVSRAHFLGHPNITWKAVFVLNGQQNMLNRTQSNVHGLLGSPPY